jgi:hypothetical protein
MTFRDWSFRRWALVIALIILLPLVGLRLHLKWRVHRAVAELRAAGKPVNWADLNRLYHQPVPDAENAFIALTNAYAKLTYPEESEWGVMPVLGTWVNRAAPLDWPENVQVAVSRFLETQREGLDEAVKAVTLPAFRLPGAFGEATRHPDTGAPLRIRAYLELPARYSMVTRNWSEACRFIEAQLALARHLKDAPDFLTQVTHHVGFTMAANNIELFVAVADEPTPELARLQAVVHAASGEVSLDHWIAGQRVGALEGIHWRSEGIPLTYEFSFDPPEKSAWESWLESALIILYRMAGFGDRDLLHLLKVSSDLEAASGSLEEVAAFLSSGKRGASSFLVPHYWPRMKQLQKLVEAHARMRAADAALAVTQYRLQHGGQLPASLADLVPEFLEAVPIEPQSGQPFELLVTPDGYGIGRGTPVFNGSCHNPEINIPHSALRI